MEGIAQGYGSEPQHLNTQQSLSLLYCGTVCRLCALGQELPLQVFSMGAGNMERKDGLQVLEFQAPVLPG